jgi:hypothetical protein
MADYDVVDASIIVLRSPGIERFVLLPGFKYGSTGKSRFRMR